MPKSEHKSAPVYVVKLRPLPGPGDPAQRLGAALKCLLRSFRLRAIDVAELPADPCPGAKNGSAVEHHLHPEARHDSNDP